MKLRALILVVAMAASSAIGQNSFPALVARGPNAKDKEKLQLFGQFVGAWTFKGTEYHDDGSHPTDKGEIHFRWVLQGRAVQDVFLETSRSDGDSLLYGTTIRFYDPRRDVWEATWINPGAGVVRRFIGHLSGAEIVLDGSDSDGPPLRWIFSNIKPGSFHWRGEKRSGMNWRMYEELDARRKVSSEHVSSPVVLRKRPDRAPTLEVRR